MKLVSLNIWNGTVLNDLMNFIRDQRDEVDVFTFQEAIPEMREKIAEVLVDYHLVSSDKYVSEVEIFNQATFIKNNLEIINKQTLMEKEQGVGLVIYTKIKTLKGILNVCNVHGVSRPGEKLDTEERLKQSRIIIDFMKDKDGPKIICGDFNLEFDTKSVLMFEEAGYRNLIKEYKIDTTRNRLAWEQYPENKQYYADFMFVSNEVNVLNFEVPKNEVSDHLPLLVEVGE